MALYGQGWMSQHEVTGPGGFQLSRAEGQPPSTYIRGCCSSSQEAHQNIALGFGTTAPTGGLIIEGVGDENFLAMAHSSSCSALVDSSRKNSW